MKKILILVFTSILILSNYGFSQGILTQSKPENTQNESSSNNANESQNNNSDVTNSDAPNPNLPKFLLGVDVGIGGSFSTMPSKYEQFIVSYDAQNAGPKSEAVFSFQAALSSYYFFTNSFGIKFGVGFATFGGKQEKKWSNAELYFKQTGFNYLQFQLAPVYRYNLMVLWLGLNIGIKVGTPQFEMYDSMVPSKCSKGDITTANSTAVGLTIGWGVIFRSSNVYIPISIEFKYNFTNSGLMVPYGVEQSQRFYAIMLNFGFMLEL